jgi:hypothetical protein
MLNRITLKCFAWITLLLCSISLFADRPLDEAMKRLSNVEVFAFGGIGRAGQTSKGEIDFRIVLSEPQPVVLSAFEKLYATGNSQAKSYALFGIRKLKPSRFMELLISAKASVDNVEVMRGCIVTREPLRDVASQIDRGEWGEGFKSRN